MYFNPLSSSEERRLKTILGGDELYFNPLSSSEERLFIPTLAWCHVQFQSTLLKWGETLKRTGLFGFLLFQSTLLKWGETFKMQIWFNIFNISIHSPQVRRDVVSARELHEKLDFNPLSSSEERLVIAVGWAMLQSFQSTLLKWGETLAWCAEVEGYKFQSTLLKWGETTGLMCRGGGI